MPVKKIEKSERARALGLVFAVFMQYEAPDYSKEGVETFQSSVINNQDYLNDICMYGAYEDCNMVGIIATRNSGNHIALFFVDGKYQKKGIGRNLFNLVVENSTKNIITVNSSPYAVEVYHRLGFTDSSTEQVKDGMRYTPMTYVK